MQATSPQGQEHGKAQAQEKPGREQVTTDVMMVQRAQGGFPDIMEGLAQEGSDGKPRSTEALVQSAMLPEYGTRTEALNIVAMTDGARPIRAFWERVFGMVITLILDWDHLEKKVWELMSMIAWNKAEKERHGRDLLNCLWEGKTEEALVYLKTRISPRNTRKHSELIPYLEKHKTEMINYHRRKEIGKPIGSGRMEKGVDLGIGQRQKAKGMSWSAVGNKALGILKVHELHEQIEKPGLLLAA